MRFYLVSTAGRRTSLLCSLFAAASFSAPVPDLHAQSFPNRPLRLIVPYAPGSTTDTLSRLVGQRLALQLGQQVVIDNRAGAGGNLGTEMAAKAPPDGYTLVMVPGSHAINPSLYQSLPFDPVADFAPVALVASAPLLIGAYAGLPASSIRELIALAKAKPGEVRYASGGSGSPSHLAMELFKTMAGVDITHVPYKGGGTLLPALISGEVQLAPSGALVLGPLLRAGRIRALAVTSEHRVSVVPDVPTVAESGLPGYVVTGWWGVLAPARTPAPIVQRLNSEIVRALDSGEIREKLAADAIGPIGGTPEDFGRFLRSEIIKWTKVVRDSGARPD